MKADGKSAKGGSDQDDKEDFGEASGRSNGVQEKEERTVLRGGQFWKRWGQKDREKKTYFVVRS